LEGSEKISSELQKPIDERNAANAVLISEASDRVALRVIRTDEEQMIAETHCRALGLDYTKRHKSLRMHAQHSGCLTR
jgi:acetate kinase